MQNAIDQAPPGSDTVLEFEKKCRTPRKLLALAIGLMHDSTPIVIKKAPSTIKDLFREDVGKVKEDQLSTPTCIFGPSQKKI